MNGKFKWILTEILSPSGSICAEWWASQQESVSTCYPANSVARSGRSGREQRLLPEPVRLERQ
jgi:hypothetical protein